MFKQTGTQKFESECKKAMIQVDNDMPLGAIHDFLLYVKGHMVELMVKNHKEEEQAAKQQIEMAERNGS